VHIIQVAFYFRDVMCSNADDKENTLSNFLHRPGL